MSTAVTVKRALEMTSALVPFDTGRLYALSLRRPVKGQIPTGSLYPTDAARLRVDAHRADDQHTNGGTIDYVVVCDDTPIAWLTRHARVVAPAADLTRYQARHQQKVLSALSRLTRHALRELATLRDAAEGRHPGEQPQPLDTSGRVLAADLADPTLTFWSAITGDHSTSLAGLQQATGTAGDVLIVDTCGYGDYGRLRRHHQLPLLCAIEELAASHNLPPAVIGDWLHLEAATHAEITPTQIRAQFTDAYAGVHATQAAYAQTEAARCGWTAAMQQAGIPAHLLDVPRFARELFAERVVSVWHSAVGGYAVFRRIQPPASNT